MLNPNPGGGMDPSGRNFGGQYGPNQGQAGNNVYNLGGKTQKFSGPGLWDWDF